MQLKELGVQAKTIETDDDGDSNLWYSSSDVELSSDDEVVKMTHARRKKMRQTRRGRPAAQREPSSSGHNNEHFTNVRTKLIDRLRSF